MVLMMSANLSACQSITSAMGKKDLHGIPPQCASLYSVADIKSEHFKVLESITLHQFSGGCRDVLQCYVFSFRDMG